MKDWRASNKECMDLTPDLWICVASNVFAVLFNICLITLKPLRCHHTVLLAFALPIKIKTWF